jgi:cytidylate kinase
MDQIPVVTIDGPSASGKGTVAYLVAQGLGFHYLDSGALYRLTALAAMTGGQSIDDEPAMEAIARGLGVRFEGAETYLDGRAVTNDIRTEECSRNASRVAAMPGVRAALLERQRAFRQPPGLVAEGRDMGTVVFPDAKLKVFLTAGVEARAERRHKQLKHKGIAATLPGLLKDLRERDARDAERSVAPLKPSPEAHWLDTTAMSAAQAAERVLEWFREADNGGG